MPQQQDQKCSKQVPASAFLPFQSRNLRNASGMPPDCAPTDPKEDIKKEKECRQNCAPTDAQNPKPFLFKSRKGMLPDCAPTDPEEDIIVVHVSP
jgi:hypothetical protein